MKKIHLIVLAFISLTMFLIGQGQADESKASKLPLVFDPATKKYFIGGNSKFLLKESEESQLIDRIEVSVDGDSDYKPYNEAVQFKKEGKHSLKFRAVTQVNNWSPVQFVEVFVDLTPPTTELKFSDEKFYKDQSGIFVALNSPVTLVSQDSLSGVANIEYSWDGITFTDYNDPIVMNKLGKKTIYYRSTDRVGNVEPVKKADLIVDGTPPTSTLKLANSIKSVLRDGKNYVSDAVAFQIEALDDASQVKQTWISTDGGDFTPYIKPLYFLQEGPHTLRYYSVDNVGNRESEKGVKLYTVSTPPHSMAQATGKLVNTGGINYSTHDFQLKLDATSNAVGLELIQVKIDSDKDFKTYIEPIRFKTPGFHTITYRAVDQVGTLEPAKTFAVNILDVAPETTFTTAQPLVKKGNTVYSPSPNVVMFNVGNSPVGVDKTLVSINEGPFLPYQGPLTLQNDQKVYKIVYKSVDKLGNEEPPKTIAFHMVGAVPILDLFISNGQSAEEQVRTDYLEQPSGAKVAPEQKPRGPASAPAPAVPAPVVPSASTDKSSDLPEL